MPDILMHALAALIYALLAAHFWKVRWRGPVLGHPASGLRPVERALLLIALICHALSLHSEIFGSGQMRFGFAIAVSVMMWLALTLYWVESLYARMDGLQILGLPLASVGVVLPLVFAAPHVLPNAGTPGFRIHFLAAMLAYSLFILAALHAVLMMVAERGLHRGRITPFLAGLPPLMRMEALLFRLIHIGFVLLSFTVITGVFFSESLFGRAVRFDHKTVFALLSWAIFALLIAGRHFRGWRGRIALRWTFAGFGSLLLAYLGSRFVLEFVLGRT